jgi:hypothetical protein
LARPNSRQKGKCKLHFRHKVLLSQLITAISFLAFIIESHEGVGVLCASVWRCTDARGADGGLLSLKSLT